MNMSRLVKQIKSDADREALVARVSGIGPTDDADACVRNEAVRLDRYSLLSDPDSFCRNSRERPASGFLAAVRSQVTYRPQQAGLGGQFQFRLEDGGSREIDGLTADSGHP
jgi:hypothetical protein